MRWIAALLAMIGAIALATAPAQAQHPRTFKVPSGMNLAQ